ncbi:hypothetical protein [Nocardioides stalactiti]|uniref:hypothetical protein n=1 Tax=Nocardioides stalactiti TaxID=2755356 RepID=UPI0015FFC2D3|nr:hypothetical protein [Nocardioides stalactiti]
MPRPAHRLAALASAALAGAATLAAPTSSPSAAAPPAAVAVPEPASERASRLAPAVCGSGAGTGQTNLQTSDGATHTYYWRIPSTAAPATGRPVLIWLHGDGGTGAGRASAFWPSTDPSGAIIVTPNGTNQTWNHRAGDVPGTPYDSQFLSHIITQLRTCASVDKARIFVGGSSRGAFMPYYLLMRSSTRDLIAGVAVNAGLVYCQGDDPECAENSDPVRHASSARMIHLHGTNDAAVAPPPTAAYHNPVDWDVDWRVFWPMQYWARQHGCFTDQTGGPNNGVLKQTYTVSGRTARVYDLSGHGAACASYQLILVTNGGHVISGQESRIWSFLMAGKRNLCGGRVPTIIGTNGADTINGTGAGDTILGQGGADTINGNAGADRLCGGAADDVLNGGAANDYLLGGPGADWHSGSTGSDTVIAKDGEKDTRVDCGADTDPVATRDAIDPAAISCG